MELVVKKSLLELAQEAFAAKEMRKHYEELENQLLQELKETCGYTNFIVGSYVFEKSVRSGSLDYKAIIKDYKVDVAPYKKDDVETWRLSCIK